MQPEPMQVIQRLAKIFQRRGISFVVGGSVASSVFGEPRSTQDVDLVADINLGDVEPLLEDLRESFYADAGMIRDAIHRRKSFNLIDLETMFKADIFVARDDE